MTPDAWVDLAYSALIAGVVALFFREYDNETEMDLRLRDSVGGRDAGASEADRQGQARRPRRKPLTSP